MKPKTSLAAVGKWHGILKALGLPPEVLKNTHGPCPVCEGTDRFRWDDQGGRGTWICSHCGAGDGMDLACRWLGQPFPVVAAMVDEIVGTVERKPSTGRQAQDPAIRIRRIAKDCQRDDGTILRYLQARGIADFPREALRLAKDQPYWHEGEVIGRYDCMVGALRDRHNKIQTLHLTYLDGHRKADVPAPRKMTAPLAPLPGCAIRLSWDSPAIGIAEGVETALAVTQRFRIPCWSTANSHLMSNWVPPAHVQSVTVFADNDANFTGQAAAYGLAKRMAQAGLFTEVRVPIEPGTDFLDEL